jgi:hypothetical protein
MSRIRLRFSNLGVALLFALSTLAGGCTSYSGDAGAKRSDQQSEQLRERGSTTQIDR